MLAEELELEESGQYRLGVDGEQRSLEGFAAPVEPAPVSFEQREPDEPVKRSNSKPTRREYRCAACGRKLPHERWVYSRHTGSRYCTLGEGCQTPVAYAKQERARDRARKEA